jgi:hypothetical protein
VSEATFSLRTMHGGVISDELRELWAKLEAERDRFPPIPKTSRMSVCTCAKMYESEPCVLDMMALPIHSTCGTIYDEKGERLGGMCWCWTGCDDENCNHPACGQRGWREFREAWPDDRREDVVAWTSEWEQWETTGRHPELLDEWRQGQHRPQKEPNPTKMLRALEGGKPVDSLRVGGMDYLAIELALVDGGMKLEHRWIATTNEDHVAYAIARGHRTVEQIGGAITSQIRLASTLDLADAPVGYQGALFA